MSKPRSERMAERKALVGSIDWASRTDRDPAIGNVLRAAQRGLASEGVGARQIEMAYVEKNLYHAQRIELFSTPNAHGLPRGAA